ncbi:putative prefoldin subunit 2 [Leptomonas pyrrhocoris]|uniref:Putative prefoldin subunit 2 n=1 Tax=Leptomonas pyrrhocoris TaxID=157538 RepID=A0A0M9FWX5_LEPPY|nr:putative prefoldin subunit 2 [Leptomonas pyrrhocoris]XP_015656006.1 putative prefoldin subunit 2 [Leptomonas pyrrhocoris]KPA77566.1 putative prefoldin subunit 2 [Leptomonas pyrrhocoris]KPA77567.1 putative prefoldin subunit 2 [Leptomonas pyrrhocoris]|eukprot:XP_015656005.1 putative prefoldin subunit 2 [Leptomonas pyrrhocoris]
MSAANHNSSNDAAASLTEEQIVNQYNRLRQEQSAIMSRIAELENESHEHDLVATELRPLNKDRCCHRLVGGALVERTVGEVLPDIEENLSAIREALTALNKGLMEKEKQMEEFMTKYKLNRPGTNQTVKAGQSEGNRGVLA